MNIPQQIFLFKGKKIVTYVFEEGNYTWVCVFPFIQALGCLRITDAMRGVSVKNACQAQVNGNGQYLDFVNNVGLHQLVTFHKRPRFPRIKKIKKIFR